MERRTGSEATRQNSERTNEGESTKETRLNEGANTQDRSEATLAPKGLQGVRSSLLVTREKAAELGRAVNSLQFSTIN